MPSNLSQVLKTIDELCPFTLAEPWDNVGLQLGSEHMEIESLLLVLDVDSFAIDEAVEKGCGAVLSHHPLIFEPLKAVTDDTTAGRLLRQAAGAGLAVIAAHTNLDNAAGGLADQMADMLGLRDRQPLAPARPGWSKLVTFVPADDMQKVRESLFDAGAGVIGNYQHCSFYTRGTGTFFPMEGADPSIGSVGSDEQVEELRLEMVFPVVKAAEIVSALRQSHSYEEPAYDIYTLENASQSEGGGRLGKLREEVPLAKLTSYVADLFGLDSAHYIGDGSRPVRSIAVVPGSGASMIDACEGRAEVLITGDIKYHDRLLAADLGLSLIDVPHERSEGLALRRWEPRLQSAMESFGIRVVLSEPKQRAGWSLAAADGGYMGSEAETDSGTGAEAGEEANTSPGKDDYMYRLYVDGGSRGNPGPAGIGAVLTDSDGNTVATVSEFIGDATNNVAEYSAMVAGLKLALERGAGDIHIHSDSELIVRQLQGSYRVKNEGLRSYYEQAMTLLGRLGTYELSSVPREANAHADELVNRALDESGH